MLLLIAFGCHVDNIHLPEHETYCVISQTAIGGTAIIYDCFK